VPLRTKFKFAKNRLGANVLSSVQAFYSDDYLKQLQQTFPRHYDSGAHIYPFHVKFELKMETGQG
jgi:hypothetical protein